MPTLVDTSVWVDHFNRGDPGLSQLLVTGQVRTHEIVIGELLSGNLPARPTTSAFLSSLPRIDASEFTEIRSFLENKKLYGKGLNWSDIALLASAFGLGVALWTRDKRLQRAADDCGVSLFTEGLP